MSLTAITFTTFATFAFIVHFVTSSVIFGTYINIKAQQTLKKAGFSAFSLILRLKNLEIRILLKIAEYFIIKKIYKNNNDTV